MFMALATSLLLCYCRYFDKLLLQCFLFFIVVVIHGDNSQVSFYGPTLVKIMSPPPKGGGGHIVFGADPVGVCICVRVASFPHIIF